MSETSACLVHQCENASWVVKRVQACALLVSKCFNDCQTIQIVLFRYNNTPQQELLQAATEQMKITELRLIKTFAAVKQEVSSPPSVHARRAGLVLNHLRGAQSRRMLSCSPRQSRE